MHEATLVYPHQLFEDSPAITKGRPIYIIEEALLLTHNPIHRQKLIFHKLSLDAYQEKLAATGYRVTRLTITDCPTTTAVFARLHTDNVTTVHVVDTTDDYLEKALKRSHLKRVWYESPQFVLPKAEAIERFKTSNRLLANFYKTLRQDKNILMDDDGKPSGGKWNFDEENRKKLPKKIELPTDIEMGSSEEITTAAHWAEGIKADLYGEAGCWLPYTHAAAQKFLQEFLCCRFHHFGPYEDALTITHIRLFHSALSPLLNVGLLEPQHVLDTALAYAEKNDVPLNSLEGFVRQILGWREFIRASYECDGSTMRQKNFFNHTNTVPGSFWTGTTGIAPVDHAVTNALSLGYNHHIERLMVLGNFMLLNQLHPGAVYRWFMGMYIDAYDWVMVPNIYGMSQFADGGSFATKPYISGANYIKKMSDYPSGDWEDTWTALYWNFIATHKEVFANNYRMAMMPRLLEKMAPKTRDAHLEQAAIWLQKNYHPPAE